MEKKEFQTESKRLLDLMINSIYTHKEIFLREIISNASDAIDKLCYLSLTDPGVGMVREDFKIVITIDKEKRTLTVSDNGIGMNEEELSNNLGVIANSGSLRFKQELEKSEKAGESAQPIDIIGQFGVGFYSAFMVADKIIVETKKYGEEKAYRWESEGADGYTVSGCAKENVGTDIIMHIREDGEEADEFSKYIREYTIYKLVKKYSDYVRYPIKMLMPHPELKEGSTKENPEYEEKFEYETLNSMEPIWQKPKSKVTEEEYKAFYKERYEDPDDPQFYLSVNAEGNIEYKALLFVPAHMPRNYDTEDFKPGLTLYSSGIKIIDHCEQLLPDYFNFVCGIVDSPDLNLNISREMLQQDRQLALIAANIEKKIKNELERMLKNDRDSYEKFYKNFGRRIKVCALDDYGAKKEVLQDLLMFWSSKEDHFITLSEYVEKMPEEQKFIYYASGNTNEGLDKLPQTEVLKEKNMDILYFTDKADEFVADMFRKYKDKPFRSVIDGDLGLEGEENKDNEKDTFPETFAFIKETLGDRIDEVKASTKLKSHPVCLTSGGGITFEMEKYFKAVSPNMPMKAKRILEVNTRHKAFLALDMARILEPEKGKKYCEIFYNQACMIAGLPVDDPSGYTDLLVSLWQ
ncbi:MAG: molecular chaperone HtpG [Lachnospiraceae bacterium]|nr:molecular chaperone HtpG [Lachnospiraceae bacterium]